MGMGQPQILRSIFTHTLDGCEILQPVDGQNPIIYRVEKPSKVSLPILVPNHTFLRGMSFQTSGRFNPTWSLDNFIPLATGDLSDGNKHGAPSPLNLVSQRHWTNPRIWVLWMYSYIQTCMYMCIIIYIYTVNTYIHVWLCTIFRVTKIHNSQNV